MSVKRRISRAPSNTENSLLSMLEVIYQVLIKIQFYIYKNHLCTIYQF
jgi:hypothetical protein